MAETIKRVSFEVVAENFPFCYHGTVRDYSKGEIARWIHYFVLYVNDEPAGCITVHPYNLSGMPNGLWCNTIEVKKKFRGKEYGMLLFNYVKYVVLDPVEGSHPSYVAIGAETDKIMHKYYLKRDFKVFNKKQRELYLEFNQEIKNA